MLAIPSIKTLIEYYFFVRGRSQAYRRLRFENRQPGSTIQSKILFKMAWDRSPVLRVLSDKLSVRKFISERKGADYLVPLVGDWIHPGRIPWRSLPREFVVKVTHGSGGVIVVSESASENTFLPTTPQGWVRFEVHPDNFDSKAAEILLSHWQTLRYEWWPGRKPEFGYRRLRPRIIVETLIKPPNGSALLEIKAYTFNGVIGFLEVFLGSVGVKKSLLYLDRFGNRLPVMCTDGDEMWPVLEIIPPLPDLSVINELSERLSRDIDFVRVDFLTSGQTIYVGELTSYPSCGEFSFFPSSYDTVFGATWKPAY